jgi:hypothetical protein
VVPARRPVDPFATWEVQHFEPSVGFYWYVRPATLICQSIVERGTLDVIDRHNDVVDRVLANCQADITASGGLFMLFDWRSVRTYDQDARARQRERMKARGSTYARRTVIAIHPTNKLLLMAVEAANLFATLFFKAGFEVVTDPEKIVANARMRPPGQGETFPL